MLIAGTIAVVSAESHMKKLEDAIQSCGVTFEISQTRDGNDKAIPGTYE